MSLEIRYKDLAARIAVFGTPHGAVETPTIMPVINPVHQSLSISELQAAGASMVIMWPTFGSTTCRAFGSDLNKDCAAFGGVIASIEPSSSSVGH